MAPRSLRERIEDSAVQLVDRYPAVSRRARAAYKATKRTYLRAAALGKRLARSRQGPQNIYHASIQRTGSRWIRSVFSDPRIQKYSGLRTYPQHEYEIGGHHKSFPKYTFIPGLYISHEKYIRIKKPKRYKTIYVLRDPRNVVISWYKSMKSTHKLVNGSVVYYRDKFSGISKERGLLKAIESYQVKISYMKDWYLQARKKDRIGFFRFEDLTKNPEIEFKRMLDFCNLRVPNKVIKKVVNEKSKQQMRKKDKIRRIDGRSDYKKEKTDWKKDFNREHLNKFRRVNGEIVDILGYESGQ